ncbi:Gx transporter family protein [Candidatus Magnetominusculus dajiuhuensis]|uniref:Gx transporter family protein n=1 Tax=Candidatus Magnetominusculus dajiuhuensis TaxID=3137712 RepID=UPI003B43A6E5
MQQREKYRLALLAACAIAMYGFERLIPTPIPWLRFGFANIITLITLTLYGFNAALTITLIRILIGSMLTGTFLGPPFVMSLAGGVFSVAAMWAAFRIRVFGPLGLSLIGAFFHNLGQLLAVYTVFIQNLRSILILAPVILFIGTLTGVLNGLAVIFTMEHLKKMSDNVQNTQ